MISSEQDCSVKDSIMKKSTATVTWVTYRNFGTILQAFALQKAVTSLGYDNHIIDDRAIVESFRIRKKFSLLRELHKIKWLYPRKAEFAKRNQGSVRLFHEFIGRYMLVDSAWETRKDLSERYDIYIAGSDQIWSPDVPFDDFYYLAFTERPKVAYAPSLGVTNYPEEKVPAVKPLLERFGSLSVREPQGADTLRDMFGLEADIVSDPTMLLSRDTWEGLMTPSDNDVCRPYALCYFLTYNQDYIKLVREYCRERSLQLKMIVVSPDCVDVADEDVYTGPDGFLQAVAGADIVLTDSFHGSIFSLIFERPFFTFRRFDDSSASSQNSRVENLLSMMQLEHRLLGRTICKLPECPEIDWSAVRSKVSDLRERSLSYLMKSLSEA